ncbi:energy transducer TonB family protein [Spirosoma litoris]
MNRIAYENEDEIRVKSLAGTLVINGILIAILLLVKLSQTVPNPPPIQFVEVNFGTDARGSGRIQTYNKASDSPNKEDVKAAEKRPNPKINTTPRIEKTRATPAPKVEDAKPAKTHTEKPLIVSKAESPVTTPERPEPKRVESPKATAPAERPAPVTPPKKVETVNNDALFKKSSGGGGSNGTVGKATGAGGNNNGDDASGVGDKGNPNGKINAKEFYGTPGGAPTGVAFDVSGWSLASRPTINDDSDETGKIVFQIKVDESGDIINVRQLQSTVSPSVSEVYRKAVQKLRLRPKGGSTPPTATGTITFIIKSKD